MKKRVFLLALAALLIAALWFGVPGFGGLRDLITLDQLQSHGERIKHSAQAHPLLSSLIFLAAYILIVLACLPVVALSALFAGYVFGLFWGAALLIGGGAMGAVSLFLIARSGFGRALRERAGGFYSQAARQMESNATSYLLFMRFVPLFPFFIANTLPALFNIPLRVFLWTTIIGIIPSGFIYAFLGQSLGEIETLSGLLSPQILAGMAALALLSLAPALFKAFSKPGNPSKTP